MRQMRSNFRLGPGPYYPPPAYTHEQASPLSLVLLRGCALYLRPLQQAHALSLRARSDSRFNSGSGTRRRATGATRSQPCGWPQTISTCGARIRSQEARMSCLRVIPSALLQSTRVRGPTARLNSLHVSYHLPRSAKSLRHDPLLALSAHPRNRHPSISSIESHRACPVVRTC